MTKVSSIPEDSTITGSCCHGCCCCTWHSWTTTAAKWTQFCFALPQFYTANIYRQLHTNMCFHFQNMLLHRDVLSFSNCFFNDYLISTKHTPKIKTNTINTYFLFLSKINICIALVSQGVQWIIQSLLENIFSTF